MGSKVLGVFGGLDLHGIPRDVTWTQLAQSALVGATTITLTGQTNWQVGDKILIVGTSFNASHTEIRTITTQTGNGTTLTLDSPLLYKHLVFNETLPTGETYSMAAEVGLLSHNIKVIGEAYAQQEQQAFGARVLIGSFTQKGRLYQGYARISNVEFERSGQEGWTEPYDPRYSLAYLDTGASSIYKPSYVEKCSFHHGYSPAIGVFGASDINITDNVVYRTVGSGIKIQGTGTRLVHNLVTYLLFPGTFNGRFETANVEWDAGIEIMESVNTYMEGNTVACSERVGYMVSGEDCSGGAGGVNKDNTAHSVLFGVLQLPLYPHPTSCMNIQGYTVYKAYITGIYFQARSKEVQVANFTVFDSTGGVFPMVIEPPSLSHNKVDKLVKISDGLIVGRSGAFDCSYDTLSSSDPNMQLTTNANPPRAGGGGCFGVSWPQFISAFNNAPEKPFFGSMSYNAIAGLMKVEDVTAAHFSGTSCGTNERPAVFITNNQEDGQHPVRVQRFSLHNVAQDNKAFIQRANVGKVNPSDCVDMDCDAQKKALLTDMDGTLLGSPGHVLPFAEQEWDGDPRHGVGDYRIPKAMLTYSNGSRIPIQNKITYRGISGNHMCINRTGTWQAYECHNGHDYQMMIIENMDSDTETRRLSPVAILSNGTIDLINGPQDHGWCAGYTCQKRLSTFMSIVNIGQHHELYFTSTSPQHLRFYLLNTSPSQAITMEVYYKTPRRMDVYYDGRYQQPMNSYIGPQGRQLLSGPSFPGEYIPSINDVSGSNFRDINDNLIYVTLAGPKMLEFRIADVIVVGFDIPTQTVSQFFGEELADNLAIFLNIPPSKVRLVEAVSASGSQLQGRKRRQSSTSRYILEVGGVPANGTNINSTTPMTKVQLDIAASMIVDATQLGNLSSALNTTVLNVQIMEYIPSAQTPQWAAYATQGVNGEYWIQMPAYLSVFTEPTVLHEGAAFSVQPIVQAFDANGQTVEYMGSKAHPWELTAILRNSTGRVIGTSTVAFDAGWVNFTDIGVSHEGTGYIIDFVVTKPAAANNFTISSMPFDVPQRSLAATVVSQPSWIRLNDTADIDTQVVDAVLNTAISDITWKNHTWAAALTLTCGPSGGSATGIATRPLNVSMASAKFAVQYTAGGRYVFSLSVTSTPSTYFLGVSDITVDVYKRQFPTPGTIQTTVLMKFEGSYNTIASQEKCFLAAVANQLMPVYDDVLFSNFTASSGSILVTFIMTANSANIANNTLYNLWVQLQSGLSVSFSGTSYSASQFLIANGVAYHNEAESAENEFPLYVIVIIAVLAFVLLGAVIAYFLIRKKQHQKIDKLDESDCKTGDSGWTPGRQAPPVDARKAQRNAYAMSANSGLYLSSENTSELLRKGGTVTPSSMQFSFEKDRMSAATIGAQRRQHLIYDAAEDEV